MHRPARTVVSTLAVLGLAAAVSAAQAPAAASPRPAAKPAGGAAAAVPPVLDRELFFGNPEIAGAQLSPDGQYVAFLKPWKDTRNVYVKKTAEPFEKARLLTTETKRPIPSFFWTRDSKRILYVKDNDGDENFNVWAVDPSAPNAEGKEAPASREPHRRQGRARLHLRRAEEVAGHDLRRPERPRRGLARRLPRDDLDRQAASCCARTASGSPAGCSTSTGSSASPCARPTRATPRS